MQKDPFSGVERWTSHLHAIYMTCFAFKSFVLMVVCAAIIVVWLKETVVPVDEGILHFDKMCSISIEVIREFREFRCFQSYIVIISVIIIISMIITIMIIVIIIISIIIIFIIFIIFIFYYYFY